jgi:hypothetical protein
MLAGLAKPGICRMPPGFCATVVSAASKAASSALAAKYERSLRLIGLPPSPAAPTFLSRSFKLLHVCHRRRRFHRRDRNAYRTDQSPPEIVSRVNRRTVCSKSTANPLPLVVRSAQAPGCLRRAANCSEPDRTRKSTIPKRQFWDREAAFYLSSQTSSMRAPLEMLLTMIVSPFTHG